MTKLISKDLTEDFWNDCNNSKLDTKLEILFPYKNFSKTLGRNTHFNIKIQVEKRIL